MTKISKFNSRCPKCYQTIYTGNPIIWDFNLKKYVHEVCPNGNSSHTSTNKSTTTMDLAREIAEATRDDGEAVSVASKEFKPSHYQLDIGSFVEDPVKFCEAKGIPIKTNLVVDAVPGSGKTTTIVWATQFTKSDQEVAFVAFSKNIALEMEKRQNLGLIPQHVRISTVHSLGFSVERVVLGLTRDDVDKDKVSVIMDDFWPIRKTIKKENYESKIWESLAEKYNFSPVELEYKIDPLTRQSNKTLRSVMRNVVRLAKSTLVDYDDQNAVLEMCERYNIDVDEESYEVVYRLPEVMKACAERLNTVDFDDMVWLPLVDKHLQENMQKFDFIFVDERQDLTPAQAEFIQLSLKENGRIVAVGDRHQSLFAFTGADMKVVDDMARRLDAMQLPLSISYRCSHAVVEEAKKVYPEIEAFEGAKEGSARKMFVPEFMNTVKAGDMVVCRTNAPLVPVAYSLIKRGEKAIIRGQQIGQDLISFVEKFNTDDLHHLEELVADWAEKKHAYLIEKGKELAAENVLDKQEIILGISNQCRTVFGPNGLVEKLRMLFSDKVEGIVLSSVHRAKGLEAENIFVLKPELMPHPRAKTEEEMEQEMNCLYVAITRSLDNLIWVLEKV